MPFPATRRILPRPRIKNFQPFLLLATLLLGAPTVFQVTAGTTPRTPSQLRLPLDTVFQGRDRFDRLVARATRENWRALPIGARTAQVGQALVGTPYENYTLEIDDRIEAPSADFTGLDCWTFYEISLGFARMLRAQPPPYAPTDLLAMIELERYRDGRCTGGYLSRMHFLEEVFADNTRRGLSTNPTRDLGGVRLRRNITEMTAMWKSYRYLRNDRSLLPEMARIQEKVSALPVYHIPRAQVRGIENQLRTGDVVAITSRDTSGYTSHVGLIVRDGDRARILHATSSREKGRKVILDTNISDYLEGSSDHAGIIIYRPKDV